MGYSLCLYYTFILIQDNGILPQEFVKKCELNAKAAWTVE